MIQSRSRTLSSFICARTSSCKRVPVGPAPLAIMNRMFAPLVWFLIKCCKRCFAIRTFVFPPRLYYIGFSDAFFARRAKSAPCRLINLSIPTEILRFFSCLTCLPPTFCSPVGSLCEITLVHSIHRSVELSTDLNFLLPIQTLWSHQIGCIIWHSSVYDITTAGSSRPKPKSLSPRTNCLLNCLLF